MMIENTKQEIRAEDAAEKATATGWICKKCKRWWGQDERMARYCCATTFPCKCGARHDKHYTKCFDCMRKEDHDKWFAKPAIEWDGQYPIAVWNDDRYFFNEEEFVEYLMDFDDDRIYTPETAITEHLESLQLTNCTPNNGHDFCMSEYLCDDLHEDGDLDDEKINKIVNDWIAKNTPYSWSATGKRLCSESVKRQLKAFK